MKLKNKNYNVTDIIKIPLSFAPVTTIIIALNRILLAIIPLIQVVVTAKFINTAINIYNGRAEMKEIYLPIFLIVLLIAYGWIGEQLNKLLDVRLENDLRAALRVELTEKRARLKYKYIENNDTWDLIKRVTKEPEIQNRDAYIKLFDLVTIVIRIIGVLIIIFASVWWAPLAIILIAVPLFLLSVKSGKANYVANKEATNYERKYEYLSQILTDRENVDERAIFDYNSRINEKFHDYYEKARKIIIKVRFKWFIKMKLGGIIAAVLSCMIIVILMNPLSTGAMSLGLFISLINEIFNLVDLMSWRLTDAVDSLSRNKEYLKELGQFMELAETEGALDENSAEPIRIKSLEFKNVSFKYPDSENYILKDMSFKIEEGRHYSFVGINGAGKTTLTKLITGLYDEFDGEILINNKSIKEYPYSELKSMISVVHQDFAKYYISFKDNIALGNINCIKNNDYRAVNNAIKTIKLDEVVNKLPNGIDTYLGKIYDNGADISGGQWQKAALARSIISQASLRILDEPTASLDPISESNIYENFKEISREGTTIFISHRLGSAKIAEKIFVIGKGKVIEEGSHEQLMKLNGVYQEMFDSQRSWYK